MVGVLIAVLFTVIVSTSQASNHRTAKERYYHARGVVRWIGHHAAVTQYSPDPHKKHHWQAAVKFWSDVRDQAWATMHPAPRVRSVPDVICAVFGSACSAALSVARCESGFSVNAVNGQYFGVFQMGSRERSIYGGSSTDPWDQVRAAYQYYLDAGWGPWACA